MRPMKTIYLLIFGVILLASNCQQSELKAPVPKCMEQEIEEFKNDDTYCETGKSVYRYYFQDKFVYVFNPGDCGADMMSDVYDENCNKICSLGGIAGNLTCLDANFWENATSETLIWQN